MLLFLGVKADSDMREDKDLREPEITPLYISKNLDRKHQVHLLLISDGNKSHYTAIKDIDQFLKRKSSTNSFSSCLNCFTKFYGVDRRTKLKEHQSQCLGQPTAKIKFPQNQILKYRKISAQARLDMV